MERDMKWKMPPLNYLRPFEATARLGTTVGAAAELGRTHGAVSRQIKLLEQWLGYRLFRHDYGRLELTAKGTEYYNAISHAFNLVDRSTRVLFDESKQHVVRVHGPTVFSSRWLIPRMHRFYQRHPNVEIWLSEFSRHSELTREVCDIAISLEPGSWPDMDVQPLMPEFIFPVCDATTARRIQMGEKLGALKLLHADDPIARWDNWPDDELCVSACGIRLSDLENVLRAAGSGHGVALARGQLVMDELASGALQRPSLDTVKFDAAYWLIKPKYGVINPDIRTFASWMAEEARASTNRLAAFLNSHPEEDRKVARPSAAAPANCVWNVPAGKGRLSQRANAVKG
jgi:LysR family transcriptional regulator, glycine cleavage system transcriptional activator